MTGIDHDRCSELLAPFVRGELTATDAAAVQEHVKGCVGCERERLAVTRLTVPRDEQALTADERERLHQGVHAALTHEARAGSAATTAWRTRAATLMAAAAVLLVVAGGGVWLATTGGGDEVGGAADELQQAEGGGDAGVAADAAQGSEADLEFVGDAGVVSARDLKALARSGFPAVLRSALAAGTAETAGADSAAEAKLANRPAPEALLESLANTAPARAEDVRECGRTVLESQHYRVAPAYGAYARYSERDKREVLILGFRWTADRTGPLDRYMVWVWPRRSCEIPIDFYTGRIRR